MNLALWCLLIGVLANVVILVVLKGGRGYEHDQLHAPSNVRKLPR